MPRKGWTPGPDYDPNASRTRRRAAERAAGTRFVGVDGEGWTDALGVHRYAQLSVGDRTLFGSEHLTFEQICEFLWDCFLDDPKAAYVGFYLGYDFSQWFRTLPQDRAAVLFDASTRRRTLSGGNTVPFPVRYKGWEFDVLGDKRFKLRKEGEAHPWMNVCDVGPFFQASLLSVISPKNWPTTYENMRQLSDLSTAHVLCCSACGGGWKAGLLQTVPEDPTDSQRLALFVPSEAALRSDTGRAGHTSGASLPDLRSERGALAHGSQPRYWEVPGHVMPRMQPWAGTLPRQPNCPACGSRLSGWRLNPLDGPVCTADEYGVVVEGKSHRADHWTTDSWQAAEADLTRYNVLENVLLSRVMARYEQGLLGCGVRLKRDQWYGPGAAAQAWMGNQGVDDRETIEHTVPADALDFARESYYGGWFEVFAHGHIPGVSTELDINSAYPAAMAGGMSHNVTSILRWIHEALGLSEDRGQVPPDYSLQRERLLGMDGAARQRWIRSLHLRSGHASPCTPLGNVVLHGEPLGQQADDGPSVHQQGVHQSRAFGDGNSRRELASNALEAAFVIDAGMPDWSTCEYEWVSTTELTGISELALADCTTAGSDAIVGSALHRRKDGTILRPSRTRGVRWVHEVRAGIAAGTITDVTLHRVLEIRPTGRHVLNDAIPLIYQKRLEVGKNTAHGKAFKLIYNSAYGKQAQSVGSPKFSNALSASYITSHCRTMILEAIATHPGGTSALLMVATDGVYFRSEHPGLAISAGELGKWDHSEKHNMTIVMPGVYYDDASRESVRSGGFAKLKSRGIPAAAFAAAIEKLDAGFSKLAHDPTRADLWPTLDVPIKFQVQSPRLALAQGKWAKAGTVQRDVDRKLSTDPSSKRVGPGAQGVFMLFEDWEPYLDGDIIRTRPYQEGPTLASQPYEKRFGMQDDKRDLGVSPDGPVAQELFDLMGDR